MGNIDTNTNIYESRIVDNIAITHLKGKALDVATNAQVIGEFHERLMTINDSPKISGYMQINDSEWDSHSAVDALVELLSIDPNMAAPKSKYQGYQHDMIAARFRHSVGRFLLTMIKFSKPTIAGMQGRISAEYLGHSLAYDLRIATADTTFSFDNMRTGLPASTGITLLLPRYIGIGRAMSLIQSGATIDAHEAHSLGLISGVVEDQQLLVDRCLTDLKAVTMSRYPHLAGHHRQHVFPPVSEVKAALENYYDAMAKSIIQLRMNRSK
jgi:enoyl-CoA hydratase/carnithine racemase